MDQAFADIASKIFSEYWLISLLFAFSFVLLIYKGIPAIVKRDDRYVSLLIEKFSSEMGLSRIAYEQNLNNVVNVFSDGINKIREESKIHQDGIRELRNNQISIEQKVDKVLYIHEQKVIWNTQK